MEQKWEKWRGTESPQQVSLSNGVTKAAWDPAPLSRFHTEKRKEVQDQIGRAHV